MPEAEITHVLRRLADGHGSAAEQLLPLVYEELRRLARSLMLKQRSGHTLEPTALVHEACVRLLGDRKIPWESRAHFFAVAATAMRQLLSNHARGRNGDKRRASGDRITRSDAVAASGAREI